MIIAYQNQQFAGWPAAHRKARTRRVRHLESATWRAVLHKIGFDVAIFARILLDEGVINAVGWMSTAASDNVMIKKMSRSGCTICLLTPGAKLRTSRQPRMH